MATSTGGYTGALKLAIGMTIAVAVFIAWLPWPIDVPTLWLIAGAIGFGAAFLGS